MILQQLLEDVTGTPFGKLVRDLVFEPLGMSDSDFAQPLPPTLEARAATAHDELGRPLDGRWHTYPELAAAGLWTTPTDLAKLAIGVQRAYSGTDDALLSPRLVRDMLTPQVAVSAPIGGLTQLGLGFFLDDSGQRFGHSGGNAGFRCQLVADRDTGQGAVVMTNADRGYWLALRAFAAAASEYGWEGYVGEADPPDLPGDDVLAGLVGAYRLGHGPAFTVERWGSGLEVTFDGQPPLRLLALSATLFRWVGFDTEFEVHEDGGLVFRQPGVEVDCIRE
jgi:CubicO group peptidase (beta-lactamase class C family)